MMDGSLKADGKTPADYDYNVRHHLQGGARWRIGSASRSKANLAASAALRPAMGDKEDGHGFEGKLSQGAAADRPGSGGGIRGRDQGGRACRGHRHLARRLQVHAQADRRCARDERHRGDPQADSQHPSRDARLLVGAEGPDRHHQRVMAARCQRPTACRSKRSSAAFKHGVRKVNIDTDLRLAATGAIRKVLATTRKPNSIRANISSPPSPPCSRSVKDRYEQFGTAGHASKIKVIPAAEMAKRYAKGELDPKVTPAKAAA